MRMLAIGSLGMAACWSGSSKPASTPKASEPAIAVTDAEPVAGRTTKSENELAREQAIEQARAAGILGSARGSTAAQPAAPTGTLDKDSIRGAIRAHLKPITLCYELRLLEDPALQGTTRVSFLIAADGSVISSTGSGFDPKVDTCVADAVKRVAFPPPAGGGQVQVTYPFSFRPAPEGDGS